MLKLIFSAFGTKLRNGDSRCIINNKIGATDNIRSFYQLRPVLIFQISGTEILGIHVRFHSKKTVYSIAHIMVQKFVMASPLYRQEQELNRSGIQLSRQTMSNWILRAADDWLTPIYEEMKKRLVKEQILHADETTLQVLKEPGKSAQSKSYMWLYRTGKYASQPMILYECRPDRKASNAETSLKEFSGWLHADGYPGYHRLPEHIRVVGCWAHLRRKFDEAVKSLP